MRSSGKSTPVRLRDVVGDGWGVTLRGLDLTIECLAGWHPLIRQFAADAGRLLAAHPGTWLEFRQVKQKFGGLRIYFETQAPDDVAAAILARKDAIQQASFFKCEVCGSHGTTVSKDPARARAVSTRCEEHEDGRIFYWGQGMEYSPVATARFRRKTT